MRLDKEHEKKPKKKPRESKTNNLIDFIYTHDQFTYNFIKVETPPFLCVCWGYLTLFLFQTVDNTKTHNLAHITNTKMSLTLSV